jgi:hypothetical protein
MMAGLSSGQFLCGFHITPRLLLDQLSLGFHCLPVYHRHAIRLALLLGAWLRAGLVHPRRHQRRHQREDRAMRATGIARLHRHTCGLWPPTKIWKTLKTEDAS